MSGTSARQASKADCVRSSPDECGTTLHGRHPQGYRQDAPPCIVRPTKSAAAARRFGRYVRLFVRDLALLTTSVAGGAYLAQNRFELVLELNVLALELLHVRAEGLDRDECH